MDQWGRPEARDWLDLANTAQSLKGASRRDELTGMQIQDLKKEQTDSALSREYTQKLINGEELDTSVEGYNPSAHNQALELVNSIDKEKLAANREKLGGLLAVGTKLMEDGDHEGALKVGREISTLTPDAINIFGGVHGLKYMLDQSPEDRKKLMETNPEFAEAVRKGIGGKVIYGADEDTGKPFYLPFTEENLRKAYGQAYAYMEGDNFTKAYMERQQHFSDMNAKSKAEPKANYGKDGDVTGYYYFQYAPNGEIEPYVSRDGKEFVKGESFNQFGLSVEQLRQLHEAQKSQREDRRTDAYVNSQEASAGASRAKSEFYTNGGRGTTAKTPKQHVQYNDDGTMFVYDEVTGQAKKVYTSEAAQERAMSMANEWADKQGGGMFKSGPSEEEVQNKAAEFYQQIMGGATQQPSAPTGNKSIDLTEFDPDKREKKKSIWDAKTPEINAAEALGKVAGGSVGAVDTMIAESPEVAKFINEEIKAAGDKMDIVKLTKKLIESSPAFLEWWKSSAQDQRAHFMKQVQSGAYSR